MTPEAKIALIQQVMAASHVFCTAADEVLERTLAEASGGQLALSQIKLLLLVGRPGQRFKVTDLASILGVTNAAASRAIDRLVQRGLIERSVSREDRRAVDLTLTPASRVLLDRFVELRDSALLELLGEHAPETLQAAAELLSELSAGLARSTPASVERADTPPPLADAAGW